MRHRTLRLRESTDTVGSMALGGSGVWLHFVDCNYSCRFTPRDLARAAPPWCTVWNFKRRRKCSRCGALGSTDRITLTGCVMYTGAWEYRPRDPTRAELWSGAPPQWPN